MEDCRISLNVGGKTFMTSRSTLEKAGRDSMLGALVHPDWFSNENEIFIDRDPACFGIILDFLRTGELSIPDNIQEKTVMREAEYYGLMERLKGARWGPLDGNRLSHAATGRCRPGGDSTAIRGSPDGGCSVAHGSIVHVFDSCLSSINALTIDYRTVNDMEYISPQRLVICTCCVGVGEERSHGGMACFDVSSGKVVHRFVVEKSMENVSAGAVAYSGTQLLSACTGLSNGLAVWEAETGSLARFVEDSSGWATDATLGSASCLRFLPRSGLVMVGNVYPKCSAGGVRLIDLRVPEPRHVVAEWMEEDEPYSTSYEHGVVDVAALEECNTVCVVDRFGALGFLDIRKITRPKWCYRPRRLGHLKDVEMCYPKVCGSGRGQLFCSEGDRVQVLCGGPSPSVVTSEVGGSQFKRKMDCMDEPYFICDMDVHDDRLFVLYNDTDRFHVWQSPPPPHGLGLSDFLI